MLDAGYKVHDIPYASVVYYWGLWADGSSGQPMKNCVYCTLHAFIHIAHKTMYDARIKVRVKC